MGKLAIVTGASRGIGESICRNLATAGFDVAMVSRSLSAMEELAVEIKKDNPKALIESFACDLVKWDQIPEVYASIKKRFSTVPTALINNAGYGGPYSTLDAVSPEEWRSILAVNLDAAFAFSKAVLPEMIASKFGRIINISSVYGFLGGKGSSAYSSAKHAIIGLTKTIAAESGSGGITCNAICPGFTDTPMLSDMKVKYPGTMKAVVAQIPVGRIGRPEEIANLVAFLVSDKASYINGSSITIDGGLSAHVGYY